MPTRILVAALLVACATAAVAAPARFTLRPAGSEGFDILAGEKAVAPVRLSTNGAITAGRVDADSTRIRLSDLRCKDPEAAAFAPESRVEVTDVRGRLEVRFLLKLLRFDAKRWQALFPDAPAPFHFLACSMPTARVWHQRGWLNATPNADPFPLLQDVHVGSPEISCKWNRNWSYLCPLRAHPIPVIGAWDPPARLYVGYDFQSSRAGKQEARDVATAYCWQQGSAKSFITLAYPAGGKRYGEQLYPKGDETIAGYFDLVVDTDLPDTEDPNERFQDRLFRDYADALPQVPAMNDLSWIPGKLHLREFTGPIGLGLWGPGGETTFYPAGTVLIHGWTGHREMPIEAALRKGDTGQVEFARTRLKELLAKYAKRVTVQGDECLFWEKPLEGAWHPAWGGAPVTTLHNTDAWYPARVLVELYRYDRARGKANPDDLRAIDGIFNWTKHFVWTRNEFADVPSSPFAIGGTLSAAFLLDYYFTFRDDPRRKANAELALKLARNVTWRYLPVWAMDSDRSDGDLDPSFLIEPNSGRDWAGLACANEVHWNIDTLTQVYVHTGDARMRYYLRGILQRWPALYRPAYEESIADYGHDAMTEGLGFDDGAGPGRGGRYGYGSASQLPLNDPVGDSKMRVVAGARAAIAFCRGGTHSDIADYRTNGAGACSFRVVSSLPGEFDVSFSYPYVDISRLPVRLTRGGQTREPGKGDVRRPEQSPSSLYFYRLRAGDVVQVGSPTEDGRPGTGAGGRQSLASGQDPVAGLTYTPGNPRTVQRGDFTMLPLAGDTPLREDWSDLRSFAGIVPGERWAYGVPYMQRPRASRQSLNVYAKGITALFVFYAPDGDDPYAGAPKLALDNGALLRLSGKPVPAWRAWPPIFTRMVLMDCALVPPGRQVKQLDPGGTLLVAATAFRGDAARAKALASGLQVPSAAFADEQRTMANLRVLRRRLAWVPAGKIAILPGASSGGAANFLAIAGLKAKCAALTPAQMIDPQQLNAQRFPVALYLGGEHYIKTVRSEGDGKDAIIRYLAGGGTLLVLASQPLPFCYGDGPNGKGKADSLLPQIGFPVLNAFEEPPVEIRLHRAPGQEMVHSVPEVFPYPAGDARLRSVMRDRLNPAHKYTPLVAAVGADGKEYGDAAGFIELGAGPARGGKILYVWSTLATSARGNNLLADAIPWVLEKTLR